MFNEKECRDFLLGIKVPDYTKICCPNCTSSRVYKAKTEQKYLFTCKHCKHRFNATHNTIFHNSKVGLSQWFSLICMVYVKRFNMPLYRMSELLSIHSNTVRSMINKIQDGKANLSKIIEYILDVTRIDETNSFVNYPGSKRKIIDEIIKRLPASFNNYYEPFCGGGNVLFGMHDILFKANGNLYISDFNKDLITTYHEVKNNPDKLIEYLQEHDQNYSKEYCNKICEEYREYENTKLAASFIFLTKASYQGRVDFNRDGIIKKNFSNEKPSSIVNTESILKCSKILNSNPGKLSILNQEFEDIADKVQAGDLYTLILHTIQTKITLFTTVQVCIQRWGKRK